MPSTRDLPNKTHEVTPVEPYVTSGDKDEFICFVIDPGLTEDQYLTGIHLVPGNPKVVHHAVISLDAERTLEGAAGPNGIFDCGGAPAGGDPAMGTGLEMLNAWAPGADPIDLQPGVGKLIPKGSLIFMNIHYHPAGTTADPDLSTIQLRLTKEKPQYGHLYYLIGNFGEAVNEFGVGLLPGPADTNGVEFLIPADSKAHVETEQFTIPTLDSPVSNFARFPPGTRLNGEWLHMHYLGFDQKITVSRPNPPPGQPAEECLAHAPQWEFSWQRSYAYDASVEELPTLDPGDVLQIRCKYNNSTDNPYVVRALQEAQMSSTIDVTYGEGETFDEMCITGLSLVYPLP